MEKERPVAGSPFLSSRPQTLANTDEIGIAVRIASHVAAMANRVGERDADKVKRDERTMA
jgi:hypothetical protein